MHNPRTTASLDPRASFQIPPRLIMVCQPRGAWRPLALPQPYRWLAECMPCHRLFPMAPWGLPECRFFLAKNVSQAVARPFWRAAHPAPHCVHLACSAGGLAGWHLLLSTPAISLLPITDSMLADYALYCKPLFQPHPVLQLLASTPPHVGGCRAAPPRRRVVAPVLMCRRSLSLAWQ